MRYRREIVAIHDLYTIEITWIPIKSPEVLDESITEGSINDGCIDIHYWV